MYIINSVFVGFCYWTCISICVYFYFHWIYILLLNTQRKSIISIVEWVFPMKCQCFETGNISFVSVFERTCRTTRSTSHGLQFKPPAPASFYFILLRPVSHCLANKHLDWIWTYQFWNLKSNTPYKNSQRRVYESLICVLTGEGIYNFTQSLYHLTHPLHSFSNGLTGRWQNIIIQSLIDSSCWVLQ